MLTFHIVSLFPESFESYTSASIIGRAIKDKHVALRFYNPRDFAEPKSKNQEKRKRPFVAVDDRPFGGGPGMVIKPEPVLKAVAVAKKKIGQAKSEIIFFDAGGEMFTNESAATFATKIKHLILICGRYEGIDARVAKILKAKRISVGPYVLTGGELPALIVIDAVARQVKGVLGNFDSREEVRVSAHDVYTRPEKLKWKGKTYSVPPILKSGNHKEIDGWKKAQK